MYKVILLAVLCVVGCSKSNNDKKITEIPTEIKVEKVSVESETNIHHFDNSYTCPYSGRSH